MIVQRVIDFFAWALAQVVGLVPPLPPAVNGMLSEASASGAYFGGVVAQFGVLVPWQVVGACLAVWAGGIGYWTVLLGIRVILWAFNR